MVRLASSFVYADFGRSVAKWVRPHHVQTDQHWMHQAVVPNGMLRAEGEGEGDPQPERELELEARAQLGSEREGGES